MKTIYKRWLYCRTSRSSWIFRIEKGENHPNAIGIFLETAHPLNFLDVEPALNVKLPIPEQIDE
jgi:threonine synthase